MLANLQGWRRILLGLTAGKVAYLGTVCVAVWLWPSLHEENFFTMKRRWPPRGEPVYASHFGTWDAAHYLYLSTTGYGKGVDSCAFYPLWPLAIRGAAPVVGGSHLIAGMILANLFSLAGWTLFYGLTAARFGKSVACWALALLIAFPGALFYQFVYSEPLFFLLLMLLWFGLERGHYGLALIAAFLLPLSRGVGVFSVLPLAWHWLMGRRWRWLQRWSGIQAEGRRLESRHAMNDRWTALALPLAPLLGFAFYAALISAWTGNPMEGIQAQKYWGVHSMSNLWNLPKFIHGLFSATRWHEFRGSVLDRAMFMLLIYALPIIWRLGKDMLLWTYVLGLLPAMSGTFTSFTRFESTAFPLFIALAVFFTDLKRKWPLVLFLACSAGLHAMLLWRFVNFRWAG